jgi:hypothetical protein
LRVLQEAEAFDGTAARRQHPEDEEVSSAWALIHAVEHLREHLGQAWLTRQLGERRSGR